MPTPELHPVSGDFLEHWSVWYPEMPPLGFLIRGAYPERWLRIHSLPESRRYPSSGWDYSEIVRRHNAVATALLGVDAPCVLVLPDSCDAPQLDLAEQSGLEGAALSDLGQLPDWLWDEEEGVCTGPMCLRGAGTRWKERAFDAFICAVALDKTRGLLVEMTHGKVYAPYDGGADLLFASSIERDQAREQYKDWLSSHPEGL